MDKVNDKPRCQTGGNRNLAESASDMAAAVVRKACEADTLQHLLDVWSRISVDEYLAETMTSVREKVESRTPYWDLCSALAAYTELYQPTSYLEIGVRQGRSACVVASKKPDIDLYLFDMWYPDYAGQPNPGPDFVSEQLRKAGHTGRVTFITGRSQETVPEFFSAEGSPETIPLMTVDGDHRDEGALADLSNVIPHLCEGGMLAFDDISHPTYPTLHNTWRSFLEQNPFLASLENCEDATGTAIAIRHTLSDK